MAKIALEQKWATEQSEKTPLEKVYDEGIGLDSTKVGEDLLESLPEPTGWRVMILPFRGERKQRVELS